MEVDSIKSNRINRDTKNQSLSSPFLPLSLQFEDPTDEMQGMRERLELRRAARCGWLVAAAKDAATRLAGAAKGKARADDAAAAAFPSLPPDDVARARAELRVTKQQVALAFEALVASIVGPTSPALRAAVRARLAASVAPDAGGAADKRVFNARGEGAVGFVMCRVAKKEGAAGGDAPPEEDGVREKNEALVEEATGMRIEALERIVQGVSVV